MMIRWQGAAGHVGGLDGGPDSWSQLGLGLAVVSISEVNDWLEEICFSAF